MMVGTLLLRNRTRIPSNIDSECQKFSKKQESVFVAQRRRLEYSIISYGNCGGAAE